MKQFIRDLIAVLRRETKGMPPTMTTQIMQEFGKDPFVVLVSCILSLRTKDAVSLQASRRLLTEAPTPEKLADLPRAKLEKLIYPVGFYRVKARHLHAISKDLLERFHGKTPCDEKDLLSLKGVGRKTANLVLSMACDTPAICVDTHVHRLANALKVVTTKTPEETESELKKIVAKKYWIELNQLLVRWGQNVPRNQQITRLTEHIQSKRRSDNH